jgi:hypothetical protein
MTSGAGFLQALPTGGGMTAFTGLSTGIVTPFIAEDTVPGGTAQFQVINNSGANNSTARVLVSTGFAGASGSLGVANNVAVPTFDLTYGSAITGHRIINGVVVAATWLNGLQVGAAPTGGDKGAGTINTASAIYNNGAIGIAGTGTNDNAPAGLVGEYISSSIVSGSAVALTTAVAANVTSISLTAGDWDVWFNEAFTTATGTTVVQNLQGFITTTTGGTSTVPGNFALINTFGQQALNGVNVSNTVGPVRLSIASTTTVFAVALANFTPGAVSAYGALQARRRR